MTTIDIVRRFCCDLYTSERRAIAASLGLPPQGATSDLEWTKLVLTTAKDRGELERVGQEIDAVLAARND